MKIKKILTGAAAVGALAVGSIAFAGSANAATPTALKYIGATPANPVYWGCNNPATSALVGGRFKVWDGLEGQTFKQRIRFYPSCASATGKPNGYNLVTWNQNRGVSESTRTSVPGLAIDGAPGVSGNGGSGGWGWDAAAKAAVTMIPVGAEANLTVTGLQDGTEQADATIMLSWNPDDFAYKANGDTGATCAPVANAEGVESCTYTDFAHTAKGDSFTFTALSANPDAVVSASVTTAAGTASATFPVALVPVK